MEARLQRLEDAMYDIRSGLRELRTDIGRLHSDLRDMKSDMAGSQKQLLVLTGEVGEINGRVAYLPNITHMITLVFTVLAAAFAIIRYGLPH